MPITNTEQGLIEKDREMTERYVDNDYRQRCTIKTMHSVKLGRCFGVVLRDLVARLGEQEQQRVAVGPGNAHCMSIRQVSLRAALAGSVL